MNDDAGIQHIPESILELIRADKFAEAIVVCKKQGIDTSHIYHSVHMRQEAAEAAFRKDDYDQSIKLYISTIGFIDPSVVLCRFIEPHLSVQLTQYLIELHKRGAAKKNHTELLFLLFRNSDSRDNLHEFISLLRKAKESETKPANTDKKPEDSQISPSFLENFDADAAIKTLIENEMEEEALEIAWILNSPHHIVQLLLSYKHDFSEAANQIAQNVFNPLGRRMLFEFGPTLLASSDSTARKIEEIATSVWSSEYAGRDEDYLALFSSKPLSCFNFLRAIIDRRPTALFANTLLSMVIPRRQGAKHEYFGILSASNSELACNYLRNQQMPYDRDHIFRVCMEARFTSGIIIILEQKKQYHEIAAFLINDRESTLLQQWCSKDPPLMKEDWYEIFHFFARTDGWSSLPQNNDGLNFMKKLISKAKLAVPLAALVKELADNPIVPIDVVRPEMEEEFSKISQAFIEEDTKFDQLSAEIAAIDQEIDRLEESEIVFNPITCDKCGGKLERKFIGFMCGHTFHTDCVGTSPDGKHFCPKCGKCDSPNLDQTTQKVNEDALLDGDDILDEAVSWIADGCLDDI